MLEGINLYSIDYYKKTVFKGSYKGVCFRIGREEMEATDASADEGVMEGGEPVSVLRVQLWKGPYVLEKTSEEVFTERFEYSDEGLDAVYEWIDNKQRELINEGDG